MLLTTEETKIFLGKLELLKDTLKALSEIKDSTAFGLKMYLVNTASKTVEEIEKLVYEDLPEGKN